MHVVWIGAALVVVLLLLCVRRVRQEYRTQATLSFVTTVAVWVTYSLHFVLTAYSSWRSLWMLPLQRQVAIGAGATLSLLGVALFVAGIREFRSLKRMSGMRVDRLVVTAIYRWSRNPQNVGWGLFLLGTALSGRSAMALCLVGLFWLSFRLYLPEEERLLERLYDEDYGEYRHRTHRYFGLPRTPIGQDSRKSET